VVSKSSLSGRSSNVDGVCRPALVLQASKGRMKDYVVGQLLHMGLCDSRGMVHSFDADGVSVAQWDHCIMMELVDVEETHILKWDELLWEHSKREALRQKVSLHLHCK
jgi:hypothetical protein